VYYLLPLFPIKHKTNMEGGRYDILNFPKVMFRGTGPCQVAGCASKTHNEPDRANGVNGRKC
jgi:hypothetical protein